MNIVHLLDLLQPEWRDFEPGLAIFREFERLHGRPWMLTCFLNDASKLVGCFATEDDARAQLAELQRDPKIVIMSFELAA